MSPIEEFAATLAAKPPTPAEIKKWFEAIEKYDAHRRTANREIVLREKLPALGELYDRLDASVDDIMAGDVFDGLRRYVCRVYVASLPVDTVLTPTSPG